LLLTWEPESIAGMRKHPFLAIRMIVDVIIALVFIVLGLGEFTARIHGWPSLVNLGSVALCLLIAAGFFVDFSYTKRRFKK
jgi:hypothetical protein